MSIIAANDFTTLGGRRVYQCFLSSTIIVSFLYISATALFLAVPTLFFGVFFGSQAIFAVGQANDAWLVVLVATACRAMKAIAVLELKCLTSMKLGGNYYIFFAFMQWFIALPAGLALLLIGYSTAISLLIGEFATSFAFVWAAWRKLNRCTAS